MPESKEKRDLASFKLTAEERETLTDMVGEAIAVQVYREIRAAGAVSAAGGNIVGNCCSCSKAEVLSAR